MKILLRPFKFRTFRIAFVVLSVLGGILLYQQIQTVDSPACKDCNLILISVDTLRPDHMGVYGYEKNTTPNIDKWAKNAVVFENARTTVPATFPTFAGIMTGKDQFGTTVFNNYGVIFNGTLVEGSHPLEDNEFTLAEHLQESGYDTTAFVTNFSLKPELTNLDQGFDRYNYIGQDEYATTDKKGYKNFLAKATNWLDTMKKGKNFLWIHLVAPHNPYSPPNEFLCSTYSEKCNSDLDLQKAEQERKNSEGCSDIPLDSKLINDMEDLYDAEIAFDDEIVGKILNKIEVNGLNKNSMVIFLSDHGEGFDHNYYFMHTHVLYESAIKIPLIISYPGSRPRTDDSVISNTQLYSTILKKLGINNKNNLSDNFFTLGQSGLGASQKKYVISTNTNLSKYSITDGNIKYIYTMKGHGCLLNGQIEELYNLRSDENEENNIIDTNKDAAGQIKYELFSYLKKYNLPNPILQKKKPSKQNSDVEKLKSIGY